MLTLLKLASSISSQISQSLSDVAILVITFPNWLKRAVTIFADTQLCLLATWCAFYLRLDEWVLLDRLLEPALLSVAIAAPIFVFSGLYNIILRHSGWPVFREITISVLIYTSIYLPIIMIVTLEGVPRTVGILQPLILFCFLISSRIVSRLCLYDLPHSKSRLTGVPRAVIYGAGAAGQQLALALTHEKLMQAVAFIDDNPSLSNRAINGLKIYPPDFLDKLIKKTKLTYVLLAMPSVSRSRRAQIVDSLRHSQLIVRTLPSFADLVGGHITFSDIRDLEISDLLGREPVESDPALIRATINNKTVLVTGAGGSIGSELCRQIIRLKPSVLILVEFNEYALYTIHTELERYIASLEPDDAPRIVPKLCSIQDYKLLNQIFSVWNPDTIYHAAAFKHVPLVEDNISEAFKNNIFGTLNIALLAIQMKVSTMLLVSTDKAVRPTNVMGATKRVAEMIVQSLSKEPHCKCCMSIVRFGNVLDSSGSVIPKFRNQIQTGRSVTVTDPEVTRYFMTIPEAAELVLQATALANGGEVFLLDMGKPVKIVELARRMIALSGLSERSPDNPEGDIEIMFTGLRPGEKMHEELLIDHNSRHTSHERIMQADESSMYWTTLKATIDQSVMYADAGDDDRLLDILTTLVDGFERKIVNSN